MKIYFSDSSGLSQVKLEELGSFLTKLIATQLVTPIEIIVWNHKGSIHIYPERAHDYYIENFSNWVDWRGSVLPDTVPTTDKEFIAELNHKIDI